MKALKLRIKDKHAKVLNQLASGVHFAWNGVNDLHFSYLYHTGKCLFTYDSAKHSKGVASKNTRHHSSHHSKSIQVKLAKSMLDKGWVALKTLFCNQGENTEIWYKKVNESYTTQTCSHCDAICTNSLQDRASLRIGEWIRALQDRSAYVAGNILTLECERFAGVISMPYKAGRMSNNVF